jgi:hypothetical protein
LENNILDNLKKIPSAQKSLFSSIYDLDVSAFIKTSYKFIKENRKIVLLLLSDANVGDTKKIFNVLCNSLKNDKEIAKLVLDKSPQSFVSF